MFSNAGRVLSQYNTRLRLLYLRSITRKCYNVFYKTARKLFQNLTLCSGSSLLEGFLKSSGGCFNGVFTLMFCESISKIFNFCRTAKTKKQLCKATTLPFLGRLPIPLFSCLIVNKCRCVKKTESTSTWNERNITEANMLQNRFELCG